MPSLTITHDDSSTETIDETAGWRWEREIGKMWKLEIQVFRDDAAGVTLEPKSDEIELSGVTTGQLVDLRKGGPTWTLVVRSFEWLAKQTEPLDGGVKQTGDDGSLITGLVNDVSEWSVGTINSFTNSLVFVFNHAHRHEAIRRIERNSPGEFRMNTDKSVDFVDRLGTDKSGSITLSSSNQNFNGEIRITDTGRDLDNTHMRVIGAHEGEAQLFANLVPSGDSGNYDNEVTYTTSRWSSADDTDWGRWSNKDVADQDTIEEEAAALAEELKNPLVEAEAVVEGEDLSLGDTVRVTKTEADLDRDMRIFRIVTRTLDDDPAATVDEVLLSTRNVVRGDEANRIRDIQRFNVAFQGSSVILQGGGSRQPVNSSLNAFESFRYPNINYEHLVEVEVRGLPYRAYSSGAASGGQSTETSDSQDTGEYSNTQLTVINTGETPNAGFESGTFVEVEVPSPPAGSFSGALATMKIQNSSGSSDTYSWDLINQDTSTTLHTNSATVDDLRSFNDNESLTSSNVSAGDTIRFDVTGGTLGTTANREYPLGYFELQINSFSTHSHDVTVPAHTHPADPGITEFASDTPTNCDLIINGTTEATNIGSGEFVTTVDVTNALNQGQWNDIEVSSDSLGHITARVYAETYKQIGSN